MTSTLTPSLPIAPCRSPPLLIAPKRSKNSEERSKEQEGKLEAWSCPHKLDSPYDCHQCRLQLIESCCSRARIHAILKLLLGFKLDHSRYDSRQLDVLSVAELAELDALLELESRSMRSSVVFSCSSRTSPVIQRRKNGSKTIEDVWMMNDSPPPSPSPLALSMQIGSGTVTSASSSNFARNGEVSVLLWFLRELCSTILESLNEAIYLRVWTSASYVDSFDSMRDDVSKMQGWKRSREEEIRWKQTIALLILFERARLDSVSAETRKESVRPDRGRAPTCPVIDSNTVIASWSYRRSVLYEILPPRPSDLRNVISRLGGSAGALPAYWPDVKEVEDVLCMLTSVDSDHLLDHFSATLYLFERCFSELQRLKRGEEGPTTEDCFP